MKKHNIEQKRVQRVDGRINIGAQIMIDMQTQLREFNLAQIKGEIQLC